MKATVVALFTVLRVRVGFPPTAQQPRNLATELFTRSFCCNILAGKGDIKEVLYSFSSWNIFSAYIFLLNQENFKDRTGVTSFREYSGWGHSGPAGPN